VSFTEKVIAIIKAIPRGMVLSYGQVALMAGHPKAARQVVWALKTQSRKHKLPWHRVLGKGGVIRLQPLMGREEQMFLLEQEGVMITDGVVSMEQFQWKEWDKI